MAEPLHTIRFKSGGMEFELTSTAEEVAKARVALEPLLLAGVDDGRAEDPSEDEPDPAGAGVTGTRTHRRGTTKRRRTPAAEAAGGTGDARAEFRRKLLDAPLEDFPQIGDKPPALYAAYAVLSWAHSKLRIEGLTAQEIQAFMREKWRVGQTYQAYAGAMARKQRIGEIHFSGDRPKVYRLMAPGETALKKWLTEHAKKS